MFGWQIVKGSDNWERHSNQRKQHEQELMGPMGQSGLSKDSMWVKHRVRTNHIICGASDGARPAESAEWGEICLGFTV